MEIVEWMNEIDSTDLPQPYRDLAYLIGMENTLKVADKFSGTAIYFPKLDAVLRKVRDGKIKEEFRGDNYKELARKYGLTEVWVRQILAEQDTGPTLMDFGLK